MVDLSYSNILSLIEPYLASKRSESASFLIWYFTNYLRLDSLDSIDAVCDQSGDKGIDGIYLNTEANVIEVYQSKISQRVGTTIGDKALREFQGTLSQLETRDSIDNLLTTSGDAQVAKLIERLDLKKYVAEYDVVGYFICNSELDQNGSNFLAGSDSIRFIGRSNLECTFVSSGRNLPAAPPAVFNISGYETSEYIVDADHSAIIAPIKASELVGLEGIANQEIFAFNVRGPLGKTQVNRDIAKSIADDSKHKLFPLFHNGITIIAESVDRTNDEIKVNKYFVVNGCQSLNALYKNSRHITDNLRILTKFIQTPPASTLSEMITRISNNQNGVKARDFKSNNQIQIRLQNEFEELYNDRYFFEIKRGEDAKGVAVISNELAGQYLMSFDLKTPWSTHRKYQIFEDKHSDLFGRPSVTAHKIVLCHVIATTIQEHQASISNELFAKYILTRFFILYIVRLILESDETASRALDAPEQYVHDEGVLNAFASTIGKLLDEVITDLNAEIDQLADDFDYRGKLRDEQWCNTLAHEIAATHKKLVSRRRMESFGELFEQQVAAADS